MGRKTRTSQTNKDRLEVELLEKRILLSGGSAVIQEMVDQVNEADYRATLEDLTQFSDRNSYTQNGQKAANLIATKLEDMGLEVEQQTFGLPSLEPIDWNDGKEWAPVSNIVATIAGKVRPEEQYIFTAHYDSVGIKPEDYADTNEMIIDMLGPSSDAPGADDNGTGTAAVLECARVLSEYPLESTVKFVLFGAEEQGLVGSDRFARYAYYTDESVDEYYNSGGDRSLLEPDPENIAGVVNLDMIGYWDGTPEGGEDLDLFTYSGDTHGISEYPNIEDLLKEMNPDLTPEQIAYAISSFEEACPRHPRTASIRQILPVRSSTPQTHTTPVWTST